MPPNKEPSSEANLRKIARNHGIRLEGPVPAADWPNQYKHTFKVIHEIQFMRYEHYKEDAQIPLNRRKESQKRVRHMRRTVQGLLDDLSPNEDSFRELERSLLGRFFKPSLCEKCKLEMAELCHEATCYNQCRQLELDEVRAARRPCICDGRLPLGVSDYRDNAPGVAFCSVENTPITHAAEDDLSCSRVSMKPDRVIGLRAPPDVFQSDAHFPAKGRGSLMLPFLVIEAKREKAAPGFQSILYQTAFPVRRFLKAQHDIESRDAESEPCLVWLLAYQGEQWRLHAGTLQGDRTRIYDLWQGTIRSQDGALQLLLIIDYIWSWARDVYRDNILELVRTTFDPASPVSTERFRCSVSLAPTMSSFSNSQDTDPMQLDGIAAIDGEPRSLSDEWPASFSDAHDHVFLRWAIGSADSPSWTRIGSIRHANIVAFEFRCYYPVSHDDTWKKTVASEDAGTLTKALYARAIMIKAEQLRSLASDWAKYVSSFMGLEPACSVRVTLFFQTYCDENTWQIKRVLSCILWGSDLAAEVCGGQGIKTAILRMKNLSGRDSVWLALRTTTLILTHEEGAGEFEYVSFKDAGFRDDAKDLFRRSSSEVRLGNTILRHTSLVGRLLYIQHHPTTISQPAHENVPWEPDNKSGDSMLAFRSSEWPETCPKFCLFVLSDIAKDSPSELHALLQDAVSLKNYYGQIGFRWDKRVTLDLVQWRKAVAREKTITG